MDRETSRPDCLQDAVSAFYPGKWFDWVDIKNKTYANLRLAEKVWKTGGEELIDNPITELPTEAELNAKLAAMQATYDEKNLPYKTNRRKEYPYILDQIEMLYDDIENGKLDKTGSFYTAIKAVKDKYPKS